MFKFIPEHIHNIARRLPEKLASDLMQPATDVAPYIYEDCWKQSQANINQKPRDESSILATPQCNWKYFRRAIS